MSVTERLICNQNKTQANKWGITMGLQNTNRKCRNRNVPLSPAMFSLDPSCIKSEFPFIHLPPLMLKEVNIMLQYL